MMDCDVCMEPFDADEHRPKILPCGHAFCLFCLQRLRLPRVCPKDRKEFRIVDPKDLPDIFMLMQNIKEQATQRLVSSFYCKTCNGTARDRCLEDHSVCSMKKVRTEEAQPLLDALQGGEADIGAFRQFLNDSYRVLAEDIKQCSTQLQLQLAGIVTARGRLEGALLSDEAVWKEATKNAVDFGLTRGAPELLADLNDARATFEVTVRRDGGRGGGAGAADWRGSALASQHAAARVLLCQMLLADGLQGRNRNGRQGEAEDEEEEELQLTQDEVEWRRREQEMEEVGDAVAGEGPVLASQHGGDGPAAEPRQPLDQRAPADQPPALPSSSVHPPVSVHPPTSKHPSSSGLGESFSVVASVGVLAEGRASVSVAVWLVVQYAAASTLTS